MSVKRARYDGPGSIAIIDSEASVYDPPLVAHLESGQLLPLEADNGEPIPSRIRDEFLSKDNPFWSEVNQTEHKTKTEDKKGDA